MQKLENATPRSIKHIASFLRREERILVREEDESREKWRFEEEEDIDCRRYVKFVRIFRIVDRICLCFLLWCDILCIKNSDSKRRLLVIVSYGKERCV